MLSMEDRDSSDSSKTAKLRSCGAIKSILRILFVLRVSCSFMSIHDIQSCSCSNHSFDYYIFSRIPWAPTSGIAASQLSAGFTDETYVCMYRSLHWVLTSLVLSINTNKSLYSRLCPVRRNTFRNIYRLLHTS